MLVTVDVKVSVVVVVDVCVIVLGGVVSGSVVVELEDSVVVLDVVSGVVLTATLVLLSATVEVVDVDKVDDEVLAVVIFLWLLPPSAKSFTCCLVCGKTNLSDEKVKGSRSNPRSFKLRRGQCRLLRGWLGGRRRLVQWH